MALPDSLILASEVIGFLSFTFTLLTAIGVYADLIKTLRGAPATIPITLGNLREEIKYEQLLCKRGFGTTDSFHILPGKKLGTKSHREVNRLLANTLKHLWVEFCDIERPFLVQGDRSWNAQTTTDASDNADEKDAGARRRRSGRPRLPQQQSYIRGRMGWVEAGLAQDRQTYYNTDLSHRFKWWWKKDDVNNLSQQLQRIQIRRIERDSYEANELIKRALKIYGRRSGDDIYHSSGDSDGDGGGGGSDSDGGGGGPPRNGHAHRRRHSGATTSRSNHRRRSTANNTHYGGIREVSEKEVIRRRASSPESVSPPRRPPSAVGSRQERPRRGSVVYEYEIVNPGGVRVEYENPQNTRIRHDSRERSYSRPRGRGDG